MKKSIEKTFFPKPRKTVVVFFQVFYYNGRMIKFKNKSFVCRIYFWAHLLPHPHPHSPHNETKIQLEKTEKPIISIKKKKLLLSGLMYFQGSFCVTQFYKDFILTHTSISQKSKQRQRQSINLVLYSSEQKSCGLRPSSSRPQVLNPYAFLPLRYN